MLTPRRFRTTALIPAGLVVGLVVGADAMTPLDASGDAPGHRRHAPMILRELHDRHATSGNWSGYAVTGGTGSITGVKGSWVVPEIQGPCQPSDRNFASFWVGIDGFSSATVEQLGTDSDCVRGVPTYFAWIEIFPFRSFTIQTVSVSPGDVVSAEVSFASGRFTLAMTNETTAETFRTSVRFPFARRRSAEWIAEAPSGSAGTLPLANFGTVGFGADNTGVNGTNAATVNGVSGPIGSFGNAVQEITMETSRGVDKAVPSALSGDGSSFSVHWVSAGP